MNGNCWKWRDTTSRDNSSEFTDNEFLDKLYLINQLLHIIYEFLYALYCSKIKLRNRLKNKASSNQSNLKLTQHVNTEML